MSSKPIIGLQLGDWPCQNKDVVTEDAMRELIREINMRLQERVKDKNMKTD